MDRDKLITTITTLEMGYLALQTSGGKLEERVAKLEASERSWAIWHAKVGAVPAAVSIALALVSVVANIDASDHRTKMVDAAKRIESMAAPRR